MVKNLPAMQETQVRSLGREDPLEKGIATQSSILAWRIPWTEDTGEPQSMGSDTTKQLSFLTLSNEENHSLGLCLSSPLDGAAPSEDKMRPVITSVGTGSLFLRISHLDKTYAFI